MAIMKQIWQNTHKKITDNVRQRIEPTLHYLEEKANTKSKLS